MPHLNTWFASIQPPLLSMWKHHMCLTAVIVCEKQCSSQNQEI